MQVRARVNQADAPLLRPGQRATIELDAYPGRRYTGRLATVAPAAVTSVLSSRVRTFAATFVVIETDRTLLPDLTAAVDVELERHDKALVVPRESIAFDAGAPNVWVASADRWIATPVTLGAMSDTDAVVTACLREGSAISRTPRRERRE
jgi:HlyD family secretion protein